jgi:hypothetical protein
MGMLLLEKVRELLGTTAIPGNEKELQVLAVRLGELLELNGEDWIRANRRMLLDQWQRVVELKTIR